MNKRLVFTIFYCIVSFYINAQINPLHILQSKFEEYNKNVLFEKLYVHTDRSFYMAGEVVWFKIYTVNSADNIPLDLNKVAYLELLNEDGSPVLQEKIDMQDGFGNGSLFLPVSVKSNTYLLRAYTSWMRNFGPEFFFEKVITVTNPFVIPDVIKAESKNSVVDIQFFPEGGDLVDNLKSRIAFKVTNDLGEGVACEGYIMREQDTVARFQTEKFGMGSFTFIPDQNAPYTVHLLSDDSTYSFTNFPQVKQQGYVMEVKDYDGELQVIVSTNYNTKEYLFLIGHKNQEVRIAEGKIVQDGKAVFNIEKSELGDGISHLTVFNNKEQPVAERLYFKQPAKIFNIELASNKITYSKREKVSLDIRTGIAEHINPANLSVSIFLSDSMQPDNDPGIIPYLLLTSELKGKIESPGYYFNEDNKDAAHLLDILMLTHGWRRFNWEDALKDQKREFKHVPEMEGHIVNFKLNSPDDKISGVKSFLSVPGKIGQLYTSKSNKDGLVSFVTNKIHGVRKIIVQPHDERNKKYDFLLINPFHEKKLTTAVPVLKLKKDWQESIRKRSIYMQAQNIYSGDKKNIIDWENYQDSIPFYGNPEKRYILDDYTRFPTMEEVMKEYIIEVLVRKKGEQYNFRVLNKPLNNFFEENPLVILDGTPVNDINTIMKHDPFRIKSLDILTGIYMLGNDVWVNGLLSYSSYSGNRFEVELDPMQVEIDFKGLQLQREFYEPKYEKDKGDQHLPDFRSLLFWRPYVIPDKEGNVSLHFYTSDLQGKFIMVIEGITRNGSLGFETGQFIVE